MRWILVFLFLYFIPLIVLFKNYNNIKEHLYMQVCILCWLYNSNSYM